MDGAAGTLGTLEALGQGRGKQRTDSTHVVAVCALNRLELAGESVRARWRQAAKLDRPEEWIRAPDW